MKKIASLILLVSVAFIFSACSQKEEKSSEAIPNPITDPGGNLQGMVNLNQKVQGNIQDSVNKENEKINNALDQQ